MLHYPHYTDLTLELERDTRAASHPPTSGRALGIFGIAYCAVCLGAVLIGYLLA